MREQRYTSAPIQYPCQHHPLDLKTQGVNSPIIKLSYAQHSALPLPFLFSPLRPTHQQLIQIPNRLPPKVVPCDIHNKRVAERQKVAWLARPVGINPLWPEHVAGSRLVRARARAAAVGIPMSRRPIRIERIDKVDFM